MNNLGVFKKLSATPGPLTAAQLAEQTGGDALLIGITVFFFRALCLRVKISKPANRQLA